jgi:hypothetical protein
MIPKLQRDRRGRWGHGAKNQRKHFLTRLVHLVSVTPAQHPHWWRVTQGMRRMLGQHPARRRSEPKHAFWQVRARNSSAEPARKLDTGMKNRPFSKKCRSADCDVIRIIRLKSRMPIEKKRINLLGKFYSDEKTRLAKAASPAAIRRRCFLQTRAVSAKIPTLNSEKKAGVKHEDG